jgi:hypothetical protein
MSVASRQSSVPVVSRVAFARLRVLGYRLGRDAIVTVDPPRKILKLAAFAAEGYPGRFCTLAAAEDTNASGHDNNYRSKDP